MEAFHTFVDYVLYTKYFEYALAFGFMGLFLAFYMFMRSPEPRRAAEVARAEAPVVDRVQGFDVPEGLHFHQGHAWARQEQDGTISVGLDDFAQKLVGKIDKISLPQPGSDLLQGERGWTLQVGTKQLDMLAPLDGQVIEVNRKTLENPGLINQEPYKQGWLLKVRASNLAANLKNLISDKLAKVWTETAVQGLASNSNLALGTVAADGALPASGMAKQLDPEHWDRICKECFLTD